MYLIHSWIRKFLLGACIGGLVTGWVTEAPQKRKASEEQLIQTFKTTRNPRERKLVEYRLLEVAHLKRYNQLDDPEAEAIYKLVLERDPNSAEAHTLMAEYKLRLWNQKRNPAYKKEGLEYLRKAQELYRPRVPILAQQLSKLEQKINSGAPAYDWYFPDVLP